MWFSLASVYCIVVVNKFFFFLLLLSDWTKCILCQSVTDEALSVLPKATHGRGCRLFVPDWNTTEIWITWVLPQTLPLSQLHEDAGILETLTSHEASWHRSCKRLYYPNRLMLHQKRIESDETPKIIQQCQVHPNGYACEQYHYQ